MLKKHLPLFIILLVALVVFWPVTNGDFIAGWDDDQQILNNPDVTNLSWESLKNYFSTYYVASYQPLASLSFGIEYYFFGENAFVHHTTNLALHLLNISLVYLLLRRLFKSKPYVVWLVTAVFAFHPLQTEVVGWISTRSTLLYVAFFLLSCLFYIKYLVNSESKIRNFGLCALFFVLALFTKSAAVTLPIVLFIFDLYFKRSFSWRLVFEKLPLLAGSVLIGLASIDSRKVVDSLGQFSDYYTFIEKIGLSAYTLILYLWKAVAPVNLITYYGYPMKLKEGEGLGMEFLLAPIALILILFAVGWCYKKSSREFRREWLFGFLFFAINIGLYINFTPFGPTMLAERYMYLPIIGVFICIGLLLNELLKISVMKNAVYSVSFLALLFFAYQSRTQSYVWKDRVSLWSNSIEGTNAVYPWMELGNAYQKQGNIDKAIEYYNGGVALNPFYPKVYYYRGLAIKAKGDMTYAKLDFERVIKSGDDKKADAFYERGLLYEDMQLLDSALVDYDSALFYKPDSPAMFRKGLLSGNSNGAVGNQAVLTQRMFAMMARGDSLLGKGALPEALEVLENVLLINPAMERALMSKGLILSNQQNFSEAAEVFSKIIDQNSANQRARLSRAYAYTQTKEFVKSITDYNFVIKESKERSGEVLYFRAIALLQVGKKSEACSDLIEAIQLGYKAALQLKNQVCD
jgi:tetratricopeptide (TPR) repeat protein